MIPAQREAPPLPKCGNCHKEVWHMNGLHQKVAGILRRCMFCQTRVGDCCWKGGYQACSSCWPHKVMLFMGQRGR